MKTVAKKLVAVFRIEGTTLVSLFSKLVFKKNMFYVRNFFSYFNIFNTELDVTSKVVLSVGSVKFTVQNVSIRFSSLIDIIILIYLCVYRPLNTRMKDPKFPYNYLLIIYC